MRKSILAKICKTWAVFSLLFFYYHDSYASGLAGGQISYQLLDSSVGKYRITVALYSECGQPPNFLGINIQLAIRGAINTTMTIPKAYYEEITPIAVPPDVSTKLVTDCDNHSNFDIKGYYKVVFEGDIIIGKNIGWVIVGYSTCCRGYGYTNLQGGGSQGLWLQSAINTDFVNSSPVHSTPDMIFLYNYKKNTYNAQGIDKYDNKYISINGSPVVLDSLTYELCPSFTAEAANFNAEFALNNPTVTYKTGLNFQQPFYTSEPLTINQRYGLINIKPNQDQITPLAYVIREYRAIPNANNTSYIRVLVGYTMREIPLRSIGTADEIFYNGIVQNQSIYDTIIDDYTIGNCGLDNKLTFKIVGSLNRSLRLKDLSTIDHTYIKNYYMSWSRKTGNNVDTLYVTLEFTKLKNASSFDFLFDVYFVNGSGLLVHEFIPVSVVSGKGWSNLTADTVYYCVNSPSVVLDAGMVSGVQWSPLTNVVAAAQDSSWIEVSPTSSRWYYVNNLTSSNNCKINDSVYVHLIGCDTVFGIMCIDANKDCICNSWELPIPNASFTVMGTTNLYSATVQTNSVGEYWIIPPKSNSYVVESNGKQFNCGINNKKQYPFTLNTFKKNINIPVLDSLVVYNFVSGLTDTNFCYGEPVDLSLYFAKTFGGMRTIFFYGDGKSDTASNYTMLENSYTIQKSHLYPTNGNYTPKMVFYNLSYQPLDSFMFPTIRISNCVSGKVYIDGNADCSFSSTNDKLEPYHIFDLTNKVDGSINRIYTDFEGKYKVYLQKNNDYELKNNKTINCNSNLNYLNFLGVNKDTSFTKDIPLMANPINYILVANKYGKVNTNEILDIHLDYTGYYVSDIGKKVYQIELPTKAKFLSVSSNASYTNSGNMYFVSLNTGKNIDFKIKFDTLNASDSLCFMVRLLRIQPEADTSDNMNYFCLKPFSIIGNNTKTVSIPSQFNDEDFLDKNDYLTYEIGFQNTTNSTVYQLAISDMFDSKLDLSTLEIIQSSHPMSIYWKSSSELVFIFKNIYLTDSASNDSASRGYLIFRAKPLSSLALNDVIHNKADLLLDLVFSKSTNTTTSRYTVPTNPPPASIRQSQTVDFTAYPNPFKDNLQIKIPHSITNYELKIMDLEGKILQSVKNKTQLLLDELPSGIYILELVSDRYKKSIKIMRE